MIGSGDGGCGEQWAPGSRRQTRLPRNITLEATQEMGHVRIFSTFSSCFLDRKHKGKL